MRKRRRDADDAHESQESHERWLISYADFITLLFAFFVVMYAISSVNEANYKKVSNALQDALGNQLTQNQGNVASGKIQTGAGGTLNDIAKAIETRRKNEELLARIEDDLSTLLGNLISQGKVTISRNERGVNVDISDSVLFSQGQAELSSESISVLKTVSSVIRDKAIQLEVGGHTDNAPSFPSNWELSAARASRVVRLLRDTGVNEYRMTAVGYGSTRPRLPNDTPEARMKNRRVTILILPIDSPRGLLSELAE